MTVTVYQSTDASAPVLYGSAGSLIALLDACLVNGYGAKAAAGWTKPFSGTNKAVYRMTTTAATGFYLNLQDNAPGTGGAREARAWGYTACTAQDTGTGQFPTAAQNANGLFIRKSATADGTTARPWTIVADATCFYLFVDTGDFTGPSYALCFYFGDFFSYKSGDAGNCCISGRITENSSASTPEGAWVPALTNDMTLNTNVTWRYIAQSWTGTGGSIASNMVIGNPMQIGNASGVRTAPGCATTVIGVSFTYPNGPDGAVILSPCWLTHDAAFHGYLKGAWAIQHPQPFGHGDTFSGTGNMAGKTFIALNVKSNGGTYQNGQIAIETSNTWS